MLNTKQTILIALLSVLSGEVFAEVVLVASFAEVAGIETNGPSFSSDSANVPGAHESAWVLGLNSNQVAWGEGRASTGNLHINASAYAIANDASNMMTAKAETYARVIDSFVVEPSNKSLYGQPGSMTVAFHIHGSLNAGGIQAASGDNFSWSAATFWQAAVYLDSHLSNSTVAHNKWQGEHFYYDGPSGISERGIQPGQYSLTVPVIFGNMIDSVIYGRVQSGVSADEQYVAFGLANLMDTIAWDGISSLNDSSGQSITEFTAFSTTNSFDYRFAAPIVATPLPASFSMAMLGFAVLGGLANWRKRQIS